MGLLTWCMTRERVVFCKWKNDALVFKVSYLIVFKTSGKAIVWQQVRLILSCDHNRIYET